MGGYSDTWWKEVENELERLANGIDNWVRATDTIAFIRKVEVTRGCKVTYKNVVCDYFPLKLEPFRARLTVGGNRL